MDYKRRSTSILVLFYVIITATLLTLFIISNTDKTPQVNATPVEVNLEDKNVVKEAYVNGTHLYAYIEEGYYNIYNANTQELKRDFKNMGNATDCLTLKREANTKIINGISDLEMIAPNTYKATVEQSTEVIDAYIQDGYIVSAFYSDSEAMDYYLTKGNDTLRFIITKDIIVLFNIKHYEPKDIQTYINERDR